MVLAQNPFPYSGLESATGLTGISDLGGVVTKVIPFLFAGAGLILLLNLISGGISLMLSRGDPKAVEGAKGRITTSLIGFIIIFAAYWIVQIAGVVLGIPDIRNTFR
jgi:hypothetical protein